MTCGSKPGVGRIFFFFAALFCKGIARFIKVRGLRKIVS